MNPPKDVNSTHRAGECLCCFCLAAAADGSGQLVRGGGALNGNKCEP